MAWYKIVAHDRIKKILQRSIVDKRIASAYCFFGIEGIGKEAVAFEFIKTVLCDDQMINGSNIDACDKCSSCQKVNRLIHQNVDILFSLPSGKSTASKSANPLELLTPDQYDILQEQMALKASNIYHKISIPKATQIKIASIRELRKKLSMSSSTNKRRFVVVLSADEMTNESANAFLKTLEEPHDNVTIILVSSKPDKLLPTIRSRCQEIDFEPLPNKELVKALIANEGLDEVRAGLIANFAQGSYGRAKEYLTDEFTELRELIVNILRRSLSNRKVFRLKFLELQSQLIDEKDKKKVENALTFLIIWLRDSYLYINNRIDDIVNSDQIETIAKFSSFIDGRKVPQAIDHIEKALTRIYRNVSLQLIVTSLFVKIRETFLD